MGHEHRTVLIVSDEQAAAGLKPAFLRQPSIRLLNGRGPSQALDFAVQVRPDLIIEDLAGQDGLGIAVCRDLKTEPRTKSIPLILVSDPSLAGQARKAGADALVSKPIVQSEYFEAVRQFIPLPERRVIRHAVNLRFTFDTGKRRGQAFSRDLSAYGAFLKTDLIPDEGTRIGVRFVLPGEPDPICCDAVIRGARPARCGGPRDGGFGIEFQGVDESDLARLQRFIDAQTRNSRFRR